VAAALLAAWIGAAQAQLFGGDDEARRRIEQVRTDLLLQMQKLDERMKALEATSVERRAILDLAGQLEALRNDLAQSRGQIEVLLHQMEVAEKRQKDLYVDIDTRLRKLERDDSPFVDVHPIPRGTHWVEPELVGQIAFTEWTRDGRLRHPRFLGLRTDKAAADVVRERPA